MPNLRDDILELQEIQEYIDWLDQPVVDTFPEMREAIEFEHTDHNIILAILGRGSGKTEAAIRKGITVLTRRQAPHIAYVGITAERMSDAVLPRFDMLNEKYQLGLIIDHYNQKVKCPATGGIISFFSASNFKSIESMRGFPFDWVIMDEAGFYRPFIVDYIIDYVVGPRLRDNAAIFVFTSPPKTSRHPVAKMWLKPTSNIKIFSWPPSCNIYHYEDHKRAVRNYLKRHGPAAAEDPKFRREYLGEQIFEDADTYVFANASNPNTSVDIPSSAERVSTGLTSLGGGYAACDLLRHGDRLYIANIIQSPSMDTALVDYLKARNKNPIITNCDAPTVESLQDLYSFTVDYIQKKDIQAQVKRVDLLLESHVLYLDRNTAQKWVYAADNLEYDERGKISIDEMSPVVTASLAALSEVHVLPRAPDEARPVHPEQRWADDMNKKMRAQAKRVKNGTSRVV